MSSLAPAAATLTEALALPRSPVAIALCDDVPAGVEVFRGQAPAGCQFWQEAATRVFATVTRDHELCAIGVHTHNLAGRSEQANSELGRVLKVMADLDYVRADEVPGIPVVERESRVVVYGPLAEFPVRPDVVLVFAHAAQSLIMTEAVHRVDGGTPPALGRPACAIVPQALNTSRAALSLGCCGARAYLDTFTDDVALWALPAARLEEYAEQVAGLAKANNVLAGFHARRQADVAAGEHPTIDESLSRLPG